MYVLIFFVYYLTKADHEIESYNFFTKVWDPPTKTKEVQEQSAESSGT